MEFGKIAEAFERLEATPKRLEMRSILVELIRPLAPPDLPRVLYLAQGLLRPEYEGVELGVADSLARRAVASASHTEEASVARRAKESGDLGSTAGELLTGVRRLAEEPPLEVAEVYSELTRIAEAKGAGSQELKVQILSELLVRASPLEGKYIVRFVLGTLRVGVREMTILDALAEAFGDGTKPTRQRIEAAFNLTSDLGLVAGVLVEKGVEGLSSVSLEVGRPIRPMLAEREPNLASVLKRMEGRAALEYKYDGLRVQAHIPKSGPVRLFSRRLEEISAQFPELVEELPRAVRSVPAILEGECVPIDPDTDEIQPFQEVSRRRGRKHDLDRVRDEIPVCLFTFDVLLLGGKPVYEEPFPERRTLLEHAVHPTDRIRLAVQKVVTNEEEAQGFFDEAIAAGGEGVMAKSLAEGSSYRAGARGFWWIKYQARIHRRSLRFDRRRGRGGFPRSGPPCRSVRGVPARRLQPEARPVRELLQGGLGLRRRPAGRDAKTSPPVRDGRTATGSRHRANPRPLDPARCGPRGSRRGTHAEPGAPCRPRRHPRGSRPGPAIPPVHGKGP